MTDLDLIYGAGFVDDDIVCEALDYSPKRFSFAPIACVAAAAAAVLVISVSLTEYLRSVNTVPVPPNNATLSSAPFNTAPGGTENSSTGTSAPISINNNVVWGLLRTFDEITEKYGDVTGGNFNEYTFEKGYGKYAWGNGDGMDITQTDRDKNIEYVKTCGGCSSISEISASDFLIGDLSTLDSDNFASECGFEVFPINPSRESENLYDGFRLTYYTHPSYKDMIFTMYCKESGFDEDAFFCIDNDYYGVTRWESQLVSDSGDPEENNGNFQFVFTDFISNPTLYGPPMTLDEVMTMLLPDPLHPEWDVESFYLVEVKKVLTYIEYLQMAGHEYYGEATVYEVEIIEDLISGEKPAESTEPIYVKLSAGYGAPRQRPGDPTYAPGEKFTLAMSKPCEGYDFRSSPGDFALRFDLPDNEELTEDDETTMLYYRGISGERDDDIFDFAEDIDVTLVTSTPQNPLNYTKKVDMETLVSFLREDWRERGISVHFE
ncbi:MAG: hypothetical protein K2N38_00070 [Oscillospiraceae bacterium]|nr:hypothetical protein [Oscillospiraceae bacterium]